MKRLFGQNFLRRFRSLEEQKSVPAAYQVHPEDAGAIQTIVFSKDRACQLDALLASMRANSPQMWPPKILWKATNSSYREGYSLCIQDHPECTWVEESHFKSNLMNMFKCEPPLSAFLVDDDLFYRPLPGFSVEQGTAYAPRLGRNCTHCWNANKPQQLPKGLVRESLTDGDLDFDCTCSLDGHVYLTREIWRMFAKARYRNPNEIEGALYDKIRPRLKFAEHSCLV